MVVDLVGGVGVDPVLTSNSSATPLMLLLCGMSRRPKVVFDNGGLVWCSDLSGHVGEQNKIVPYMRELKYSSSNHDRPLCTRIQ